MNAFHPPSILAAFAVTAYSSASVVVLAREAPAVNAAPSFKGGGSADRSITLASLRGKPVVLLVAPSPRDHAFRRQLSGLKERFERLAEQGTLCFVAFTGEGGQIPSNIPFITVNDPVATASAFGVAGGFAVAVIGRDGNLDCLSVHPLPGQRILDLVNNNASVQEQFRR